MAEYNVRQRNVDKHFTVSIFQGIFLILLLTSLIYTINYYFNCFTELFTGTIE